MLKVIGAGFGRTGTLSLKTALEDLGFGPCHHMMVVLTQSRQLKLWDDIARGKRADWNKVFSGFGASVDWPSCKYYRELMEAFPDAKVVLSIRDEERWYESAKKTIYSIGRQMLKSPLSWIIPRVIRLRRMSNNVIWGGTFADRFEDRDYALQVYRRHIEEVKKVVPPERLLVYEVKEGWEPLCKFLGVPVPDKPFPRLNDSDDYRTLVRNRMIKSTILITSQVVLTFAAVMALLYYTLVR